MPKDDWAPTRRRDAIRRAKAGKSWSSFARPKKSKSKAKRKQKIRSQAQASKRQHDKVLGNAAPPSQTLFIAAGTTSSIRKHGTRDWAAYVTQKGVTAAITFKGADYVVARFQNWLIKIPRPRGF